MLGKLFSSAASLTARGGSSSNSRPTTALESVQEDIHTRNLLFPEASSLAKHHHEQVFPLSPSDANSAIAKAYDYATEPEIDLKDVRVIIMQEATSFSQSATLLYDSCPPPKPTESKNSVPATNGVERRRSLTSQRKTSIGDARPVLITHDTATPRGFGAFDRKTSNLGRASYAETDGQRSAREYREEMTTFSSCIFGSSDIMAYKGTGTKVHLISAQTNTSASPGADGMGSLGRSSMRGSRLAQSTSDHVPLPTSVGLSGVSSASRTVERKKALITRIFPVVLPNDDPEEGHSTSTSQTPRNGDVPGFPFPQMSEQGDKKNKPRQKRTPMYAVGLIVQLPSHQNPRNGFRTGSFYEHESCPSSFNSSKWVLPSGPFGPDAFESFISNDVDDGMHLLTPHWDIIMRTLTHLQNVVSTSVLNLLKKADLASPEPPRDLHMRRSTGPPRPDDDVRMYRPPKSNAKLVQLMPNALCQNETIRYEVIAARQRIVTGIKAQQVIRGQGRWGIWREEARWVGRWAGGKEEGFFFFNLLTGFLGNHTEWLQYLGPSEYRRRYQEQQRANRDDEIGIPARTVILANEKMAARRLIFLLSAFLPSTQHPAAYRGQRSYPSASFNGYSQSPPINISGSRDANLYRRMNRNAKRARAMHSRTMSFPAQAAEAHHDRRTSDAASIKTANLPIPGSDGISRKSSAATTTTITPITTMPHFSSRASRHLLRPESSGSVATDDLLKSLKRGDSTGHYSTASTDSHSSIWGSITTLWTHRRRESTNLTVHTPPSENPVLGEIQHSPRVAISPSKGRLSQMVEEVQRERMQNEVKTAKHNPEALGLKTNKTGANDAERGPTSTERVTTPGIFDSGVKTSINSSDGIIDIDVPLPDFLSQSAISSPSSSGYLSVTAGNFATDNFDHASRTGPELEAPMNVAGWLPRYHPDFVLQAIPAQDVDRERLVEDVKNSLRAEPTPVTAVTPGTEDGQKDRWVDISSALIADTTNFSIKRIRYRRLIKVKPSEEMPIPHPHGLDARSIYGNPYGVNLTPAESFSETEEKFIEEPIISMDETLIEAVERIIAQSGETSVSKDTSSISVTSSRSTSRKGGVRERSDSDSCKDRKDISSVLLEVPRNECKKMVINALEEIVREVVEDRREGTTDSVEGEGEERRESVLREGVRSWLVNVEEAA